MDTSGIFGESSSTAPDTGEGSAGRACTVNDTRRTRLHVEDHLERLAVERDQGIEAREIEVVLDEVFADLGEVLVAGEGAEPADPGEGLGAALADALDVVWDDGIDGGSVSHGGGQQREGEGGAGDSGSRWGKEDAMLLAPASRWAPPGERPASGCRMGVVAAARGRAMRSLTLASTCGWDWPRASTVTSAGCSRAVASSLRVVSAISMGEPAGHPAARTCTLSADTTPPPRRAPHHTTPHPR